MFKLDTNNFEKSHREAKDYLSHQKKELIKITAPFWRDNLEQKRKSELSHIAKFILCLDKTINLEQMVESPDFIISKSGKTIGLEIRQLYTKNVESIKYLQKLFDNASQEFEEGFPDEKMLVNFWLKPNFSYRRKDRSAIVEEIVEYVHSIKKHISILKPSFIETIDVQPHSKISFNYNEGIYNQEELENEIVLSAIEEKELKIENYTKNSGTEFQWLLLVNSEAGSDSFDTYDFEGIENIQSKFEHIFLLKDFNCEIVKIK